MKNPCALMTLMFLATAWMTAPAGANLITHSTSGVLQSDHFEGDTVGTAPAQWTVSGTPEVQDFSSAGLSAFLGTKFVELYGSEPLNAGEDDIRTSFTALNSGVLTTSFAFYMVSGTGATGHSRFRVKFFENDGVSIAGQVGFASDTMNVEGTSLTFNLDAWNTVTMAIDLTAPKEDAINITVNGFSDTADMLNDNAVAHVEFSSRLSGGTQVFVDAIPEPSTFSLLTVAFGTLGWLRWRLRTTC